MRIACFVFGIAGTVLAVIFALVAVGQVIFSSAATDSMNRYGHERAFYQWSGMTTSFATLAGLSFIAAAIFKYAERPAMAALPANRV